ncbi:MAG: RNA ligase [Zetaproteobacteria bacterium]|nr:MAG: RNA ligase [Zetaproteobacteria bacterium]
MEEKVDGYNVRFVRVGRRIVGFSRGGFVCPFATDRARDWFPRALWRTYPDLVVCAEVAGPETPHADAHPRYIQEDAQAFVFDMMRINSPEFLPREEVYALADRFGLTTVERLGRIRASDEGALERWLRRYEDEGREGFVFKGKTRVKYVTKFSAIEDVQAGAPELMELPAEFFTLRVLRLALALAEAGEDPARYAERLGRAFLEPLLEAVHAFAQTGHFHRIYRCRVHSRRAAEEILSHFRHEAHLRVRKLSLARGADGMWRLAFAREPVRLAGLVHHLLKGGAMFD